MIVCYLLSNLLEKDFSSNKKFVNSIIKNTPNIAFISVLGLVDEIDEEKRNILSEIQHELISRCDCVLLLPCWYQSNEGLMAIKTADKLRIPVAKTLEGIRAIVKKLEKLEEKDLLHQDFIERKK